jgi:TP901-1 family phage major tail protein
VRRFKISNTVAPRGDDFPKQEAPMGAQNGKDLLLKIDMTGDGQFETVAGLRATRLSLNAQSVDVTSLSSPGGWRELLGGAGMRSASISGSGVFRDAATDARARVIFFDGATPPFQVIIPDFGTILGPFMITSLDYAGSHDGEATFEIALASAGQITFVPDGVELPDLPAEDPVPELPFDPTDPPEPENPLDHTDPSNPDPESDGE